MPTLQPTLQPVETTDTFEQWRVKTNALTAAVNATPASPQNIVLSNFSPIMPKNTLLGRNSTGSETDRIPAVINVNVTEGGLIISDTTGLAIALKTTSSAANSGLVIQTTGLAIALKTIGSATNSSGLIIAQLDTGNQIGHGLSVNPNTSKGLTINSSGQLEVKVSGGVEFDTTTGALKLDDTYVTSKVRLASGNTASTLHIRRPMANITYGNYHYIMHNFTEGYSAEIRFGSRLLRHDMTTNMVVAMDSSSGTSTQYPYNGFGAHIALHKFSFANSGATDWLVATSLPYRYNDSRESLFEEWMHILKCSASPGQLNASNPANLQLIKIGYLTTPITQAMLTTYSAYIIGSPQVDQPAGSVQTAWLGFGGSYGSNYAVGDIITLTGGVGIPAKYRIISISSSTGAVSNYESYAPIAGYPLGGLYTTLPTTFGVWHGEIEITSHSSNASTTTTISLTSAPTYYMGVGDNIRGGLIVSPTKITAINGSVITFSPALAAAPGANTKFYVTSTTTTTTVTNSVGGTSNGTGLTSNPTYYSIKNFGEYRCLYVNNTSTSSDPNASTEHPTFYVGVDTAAYILPNFLITSPILSFHNSRIDRMHMYQIFWSGSTLTPARYIHKVVVTSSGNDLWWSLLDTNIVNSDAFRNLLALDTANIVAVVADDLNMPVIQSQIYNPVKKRLYYVENNTGLLHIFTLNSQAPANLGEWWAQPNSTKLPQLSYTKSIAIPANIPLNDHSRLSYTDYEYINSFSGVSFSLEYDTTSPGTEEFLCWRNLDGAVGRINWSDLEHE